MTRYHQIVPFCQLPRWTVNFFVNYMASLRSWRKDAETIKAFICDLPKISKNTGQLDGHQTR